MASYHISANLSCRGIWGKYGNNFTNSTGIKYHWGLSMTPVRYHSNAFPPRDINLEKLYPHMSAARTALGRYDGILEGVINPNILISPMLEREAEQSSRIEGTQATIKEVLEFEAGNMDASDVRKHDIQEILNYRKALTQAVGQLENIPLSQRLIKDAHAILMQGVRGKNSNPGHYRSTQNYVGPQGCREEDALFLPPPANELLLRMDTWERYLHQDQPDLLMQTAVLHAEFEAIHPFLDGNGRLGRMMIPLFLLHKGLISRPSFYISEELEKNREDYYEKLRNVSAKNEWDDWCVFFLDAMRRQADHNFNKVKLILELYEKKKLQITDATGSQYAIQALDYFFTRPIFSSSQLRAETSIPNQTTKSILRKLKKDGFLQSLRAGRGQRPEIFGFIPLLEIIG